MPCLRMGNAIVCVGNEPEEVTLSSGRKVLMEWHNYLGPCFLKKNGDPMARQPYALFDDPALKKWIGAKCDERDAREKKRKRGAKS